MCEKNNQSKNYDFSALLEELLINQKFSPRRECWVALDENYFFKIPRISGDLISDTTNPESLKIAREEYHQIHFLNQLDDAVAKPVCLVENFSCLVMERIQGRDMISVLKEKRDSEAIQLILEEGVSFCARLHRFAPRESEDFPYHDYSKDKFYPAGPEEMSFLKHTGFTIVVGGYEIRNFMQDQVTGHLKFFDPHNLYYGLPEEDFARYVLSILMTNWGRQLNCLIWKKFDLKRLVKIYEEIRGVPLDKRILTYTLDLNVAMRKYYAGRAVKKMPPYVKFIGKAYKKLFFHQINTWRLSHGI